MLHIVLNTWTTYFTSTYNKLTYQRILFKDLIKTRDLTIDYTSKEAIKKHITKEKAVEIELVKHEKEWLREASKSQVSTKQATKHVD
jgi:hypothetical protein